MTQTSLFDHYPRAAGAKEETTSRDAARAIEASGRAPTLREAVALHFKAGHASTADEVAKALREEPWTIRPRVTELYKQGLIVRTGERRLSMGGRPSHVYRVA
ncbi:MAG TPA: hypothetical protein VK196_17080 [Magnetospirillum sp.]|nr:hypothetical protein [Magnetospirillum sp.]